MGIEYFLVFMVCCWAYLRIKNDCSEPPLIQEETLLDVLKSIESKLDALLTSKREAAPPVNDVRKE